MFDNNNIFSYNTDPCRTADMQIYGIGYPKWGSRQQTRHRNIAGKLEKSNIFMR